MTLKFFPPNLWKTFCNLLETILNNHEPLEPSRIKTLVLTPNESGPLLTRSPARIRLSIPAWKFTCTSNSCSSLLQPCTSPTIMTRPRFICSGVRVRCTVTGRGVPAQASRVTATKSGLFSARNSNEPGPVFFSGSHSGCMQGFQKD